MEVLTRRGLVNAFGIGTDPDMRRRLAIIALTVVLVQCAWAQEKPGADPRPAKEPLCCFTARVKWIEMVGKRECEAVPLGMQFDLNWLVGIEILSVEKPAKPFDKKGDKILAIHSPALFFAPQTTKKAIGMQYSIQVFGELKDGVPRYHYAELKEKRNGKIRQRSGRSAG